MNNFSLVLFTDCVPQSMVSTQDMSGFLILSFTSSYLFEYSYKIYFSACQTCQTYQTFQTFQVCRPAFPPTRTAISPLLRRSSTSAANVTIRFRWSLGHIIYCLTEKDPFWNALFFSKCLGQTGEGVSGRRWKTTSKSLELSLSSSTTVPFCRTCRFCSQWRHFQDQRRQNHGGLDFQYGQFV